MREVQRKGRITSTSERFISPLGDYRSRFHIKISGYDHGRVGVGPIKFATHAILNLISRICLMPPTLDEL